MRCPNCNSEHQSKVYWCKEKGDQVRRYRECAICGQRFVTVEQTKKVLGQPVKKG